MSDFLTELADRRTLEERLYLEQLRCMASVHQNLLEVEEMTAEVRYSLAPTRFIVADLDIVVKRWKEKDDD